MNNIQFNNLNRITSGLLRLLGMLYKELTKRWIIYLEIVIFFGAALGFDLIFLDGNRFYHIQPHPFWIVVLLISVLYGAGPGVLSAIAASCVLLWGNVPEQTLNQDMYEWFFATFKLPILWLITAIVIGKISARHIAGRNEVAQQLNEFSRRQETLMNSFQQIKTAKEKMEMRVAGQRSTIHRVLTAARDVESLEPIQVLERAQGLVKSMLEPEEFSIFILKDHQLHLAFDNGWLESNNYQRVYRPGDELFDAIVERRQVLCIIRPADEAILNTHAVLASPLIVPESGELFGMLKIEKQRFSKLSQNTIKELSIVCEWIGSIYGKADACQDSRKIVSMPVNGKQ